MSAIFGRTKSQQDADNSNVFGDPSKTRKKDEKEQEANTEQPEQAPNQEEPVNQEPVESEEGSSGESERTNEESTQNDGEEKVLIGEEQDG